MLMVLLLFYSLIQQLAKGIVGMDDVPGLISQFSHVVNLPPQVHMDQIRFTLLIPQRGNSGVWQHTDGIQKSRET